MTKNRHEKFCPNCKQVKPLGEFYRNRSKSDGLQSFCKTCKGIANRAYAKTEKGRAMYRRMQKKRLFDSAKTRAYGKVFRSVKLGKMPHISTQNCSECNKQADEYHHHKGYGKAYQLNVVPLCKECHTEAHSH